MRAIETVTTPGETAALCQSVGVSRASLYRRRRPAPPSTPRRPRAPSPRALGATERQAVLDVLHSERFVDQSPAEVHATLLEEQTYLCAPRTMYRVLAAAREVRERRAQARHPAYTRPELVATGPNQVWSWDITKLKGPIPYLYYSLYVILDLFSRYAVGWMVARHENAHLAERLIAATCLKQGIVPHHLTIHADRGAPMRSKLVALLFSDLGIDASHSRPRVSNDNPFSEAQFRTVKYRPEFPGRFGSLAHARDVSRDLFAWYNDAHHHSGLSYLTPAAVHYGRAATVLTVRHRTRLAAYAAHPERFVQGPPRPETLPTAVWINRPPKSTREDATGATPVTPDDPQHGVDPPVTAHPRRSLDHARHQRGLATVNAESGCLKGVDTARSLAIGATYTQLSNDDSTRLTGDVPHPLFFGEFRQTTPESLALRHKERALHAQAAWLVPVVPSVDRVEIWLTGGLSFFHLTQGVIVDVDVSETLPPFTLVNLDAIHTQEQTATAVGGNVGVDVAYLITDRIGVGGFLRYAGASADLPTQGGDVSVRLGGMQVGAGVRIRLQLRRRQP